MANSKPASQTCLKQFGGQGWNPCAPQETGKLLRCDDEASAARRALEVERIRLAHESGELIVVFPDGVLAPRSVFTLV